MKEKEFEEIVKEVKRIRAEKKATLKGIELMHWNLFWKLRDWIVRETGLRVVCVSEVVDKIKKYAPRAILNSRDEFTKAVESLWSAAHDYSLHCDAWLMEELDDELSYIYK